MDDNITENPNLLEETDFTYQEPTDTTDNYLEKMRDIHPEYADVDDTTFALSFKDRYYAKTKDDDFLKAIGLNQTAPVVDTKPLESISEDVTTTRESTFSGLDEQGNAEYITPQMQDEKIDKENKEILFGSGEEFKSKEWSFSDDVIEPFKRGSQQAVENNIMAEAVLVLGDDVNNPEELAKFLKVKDDINAYNPVDYLKQGVVDIDTKPNDPHNVDTFLEATQKKGLLSTDTWLEFLKAAPSITAGSIVSTAHQLANPVDATVSLSYKLASDSLKADGIKVQPTRIQMAKAAPVALVIVALNKLGFKGAAAPLKEAFAKSIIKNSTKKLTDVAKSFAYTTANGVKHELPTEIVQEIIETVYVNDTETTGEDILKASIGAVMGTAGMTTSISATKEIVSATKAKSAQSILADEINKAVDGTKIDKDILNQNVLNSFNPNQARYRVSNGIDKIAQDFENEIKETLPIEPKDELDKIDEGYKELETELFSEETLEKPKADDSTPVEEAAPVEEVAPAKEEPLHVEPLSHPRVDELLDMMENASSKDFVYEQKLVQPKTDTSPALYASNPLFGFSLTKTDVKNIREGKINEKLTAKLENDLGILDNDPQWEQVETPLHVEEQMSEETLEKPKADDSTPVEEVAPAKEEPLHVEPLSHPRVDELLDMMENASSKDFVYEQKLVQPKTDTSPALYAPNPLFGFSLTKTDVKNIREGKIDEKLTAKLENDLGILDNDPQWEQVETPLHVEEQMSEDDWAEADKVFMETPAVKENAHGEDKENLIERDSLTSQTQDHSLPRSRGTSSTTSDDKSSIAEPTKDSQADKQATNFKGTDFTSSSPKGQGAVDFLLEKKEGYVTGAFTHSVVGDIDLIWGDNKAGLKHIIERRTEQWGEKSTNNWLKHLAEIVEDGTVSDELSTKERVVLISKKSTALIELTYNSEDNHWLISAFRDSKNKKRLKEMKSKNQSVNGDSSLVDEPIPPQSDGGAVLSSKASETSIAEPTKDSQEFTTEERQEILNMGLDTAGVNYIKPFAQDKLPQRPESEKITIGEEVVTLPTFESPLNIGTVTEHLRDIAGNIFYEKKIAHKNALGTYNPNNVSIRTKNRHELDVKIHETGHFLDHSYSGGKLFKEFKKENALFLQTVSYTSKKDLAVKEGFAEFVRLWATKYNDLVNLDAGVVTQFEKVLSSDKKLEVKMKKLRSEAHKFYHQGALVSGRANIGVKKSKDAQKIADKRLQKISLKRQELIDKNHSIKLIETRLKGNTRGDAKDSAFKQFALINGAEGVVEMVLSYGVPTVNTTTSEIEMDESSGGLDSVFAPVVEKGSETVREMELYFVGRRAKELKAQDRENLMSTQQIEAALKLEEKHDGLYKEVFEKYQAFNKKMLDFYVSMNLITTKQRDAFLDKGKNYVPFYRVRQSMDLSSEGVASSDINQRLTGGDASLNSILENIYDQVTTNIIDAHLSRAKSTLYDMIDNNRGGEFAVKIAASSKKARIAKEEQAVKVAQALVGLGMGITKDGKIVAEGDKDILVDINEIVEVLELNPDMLEFWVHGQKPTSQQGVIDSAIIDDKLVYFEVNDALLIDTLNAQGSLGVHNKALQATIMFKNAATLLTTDNPLFYGTNALRDTVSAMALSESGFVPFYHTFKGMIHYLLKTGVYKKFMANGGGGSSRRDSFFQYDDTTTSKFAPQSVSKSLTLLQKILSLSGGLGNAIEYGTRIGEAQLIEKSGKSALEGSFGGRDISTDFRIRGSNENVAKALATIAFAKAGINSIDKITRTMFEVDGKTNIKNAFTFHNSDGSFLKNKLRFYQAGAGITTFSIALFLMNKDDERYKRLTPDQKGSYWYIYWDKFGIDTKAVFKLPKPHQIGSLFASIPEMIYSKALHSFHGTDTEKEQFGERLLFEFTRAGAVLDLPSVLKGVYDIATNADFRGVPIEGANLKRLTKENRYKENTPILYKKLGNSVLSPVQIQHLVNSLLGLTGRMIDDSMEAFFWDKKSFGERPFASNIYNPFDYLSSRLQGKEVEFRTKFDGMFYEIYSDVLQSRATLKKLKTDARKSLRAKEDYKQWMKNPKNRAYSDERLAQKVRKIQVYLRERKERIAKVRKSPQLTNKQKESRINTILRVKHTKLEQEVDRLKARLEARQKAFEKLKR